MRGGVGEGRKEKAGRKQEEKGSRREERRLHTANKLRAKSSGLFNSNRPKAWPMYNNEAQYINSYCATFKLLLYFLVTAQIKFIVQGSRLISIPRRLGMMPNRSVNCLETWHKSYSLADDKVVSSWTHSRTLILLQLRPISKCQPGYLFLSISS